MRAGTTVAAAAGTSPGARAPAGRVRPAHIDVGRASPRVRRDIQGLRALAVVSGVADHAGIGVLAGGFVGVDVFFVLSGFLITSLLVREAERTGRIGLLGFYARRARRVL
jgi:peptidoglycan/LPS O-acetylase OafA/YrhL